MPSYRVHIWGSALLYLCLIPLMNQVGATDAWSIGELLLCTLLGGLFPDIDIKSKGQKICYVLVLCALGGLYSRKQFALALALGCASFLPLLVSHRGLFHNPLFIILLLMGGAWVTIIMGQSTLLQARILRDLLFFGCGAFAHLFLDRYYS